MEMNGSGCDEIPVNVRVCDLRLPLRVIMPLFPIAIPKAFQECECELEPHAIDISFLRTNKHKRENTLPLYPNLL